MKYAWPILKAVTIIAALFLIIFALTFPNDTLNASDLFFRKSAFGLGAGLLGLLIALDYSEKKRK